MHRAQGIKQRCKTGRWSTFLTCSFPIRRVTHLFGEDSFSLCSASHCPSISVLARPPWHLKDTASSVLPTFPFSFSRVRHLHLENKTRAQQCVAATVSFISRLPASNRPFLVVLYYLVIGMSLARVPLVPYLLEIAFATGAFPFPILWPRRDRSQILDNPRVLTFFFSFSSSSRALITFFPRRILAANCTADGAPHNQQQP